MKRFLRDNRHAIRVRRDVFGGRGVSNVASLHRTSTAPQPDRIGQRGRIAWRAPHRARIIVRRLAAKGGSWGRPSRECGTGETIWGVGVMAGVAGDQAGDQRNRLGRREWRIGSRLRLADYNDADHLRNLAAVA